MDTSPTSDSALRKKLRSLQQENEQLKKENTILRERLGVNDPPNKNQTTEKNQHASTFNKYRPSEEKVALYLSLFKGREEVFAKRWENKKGRTGYSPVCHNEWKPGICKKPQIKCSVCTRQHFQPLDEQAIEAHLRGDLTAGIYPLLSDNSCYFLAIDFDKKNWQQDIQALMEVCKSLNIPFATERSRSGNGAHLLTFKRRWNSYRY